MSNIQAGLLVPALMVIFLILTFFVFRFFTLSARKQRNELIDAGTARYQQELSANEPDKAALVMLKLLSSLKPGNLSYAETAPLFLNCAKALSDAKNHQQATQCALIIQKQIPNNTIEQEATKDKADLLNQAREIYARSSKELSTEQREQCTISVDSAWGKSPNTMHLLLLNDNKQ